MNGVIAGSTDVLNAVVPAMVSFVFVPVFAADSTGFKPPVVVVVELDSLRPVFVFFGLLVVAVIDVAKPELAVVLEVGRSAAGEEVWGALKAAAARALSDEVEVIVLEVAETKMFEVVKVAVGVPSDMYAAKVDLLAGEAFNADETVLDAIEIEPVVVEAASRRVVLGEDEFDELLLGVLSDT
jgi:hypothetical protein